MKIYLWFLIAGLGLAAGCGPAMSGANDYQAALASWRGAPVDEMVRQWGPPRGQTALPDGGRQYVWRDIREIAQAPGAAHVPSVQRVRGPDGQMHSVMLDEVAPLNRGSRYEFCETTVVTDARGNILSIGGQGNNCAGPVPAYSPAAAPPSDAP